MNIYFSNLKYGYPSIIQIIFIVGYDVTFNTYEWYRPPKLHKNIILDNHDVAIEAYNDTYISEGNLIRTCQNLKAYSQVINSKPRS